jgi:uncharacterized protein YeaO (DUF488 family)
MIRCKRVYDPVEASDGQRVLVDRLWPRNKRKEDLHGQWLREVAPSDELRKAFHAGELDFAGSPSVTSMNWPRTPSTGTRCWTWRKGDLTLLYAGKDTEHNNARVLADWLEDELSGAGRAVRRCAMPQRACRR